MCNTQPQPLLTILHWHYVRSGAVQHSAAPRAGDHVVNGGFLSIFRISSRFSGAGGHLQNPPTSNPIAAFWMRAFATNECGTC
jgi:hypothetical protein